MKQFYVLDGNGVRISGPFDTRAEAEEEKVHSEKYVASIDPVSDRLSIEEIDVPEEGK